MSVTRTSPACTRSISAAPTDIAHRTDADLLPDRAAGREHCTFALEPEALLGFDARLRLHRFRTRLQDVDAAVEAVLAPLDVHRPAVVLLDQHRVAGEFEHVGISQREAMALGVGDVDSTHRAADRAGRIELHPDQFAADATCG